MSVRWDEQNVHAQCPACNVYKGGCQDEYAAYVVKTYGQDNFERLMREKRVAKKWTAGELTEMAEKYLAAARERQGRLVLCE
jgi:cytosine/adenosine deaminase-related metal-dependent hydrolase